MVHFQKMRCNRNSRPLATCIFYPMIVSFTSVLNHCTLKRINALHTHILVDNSCLPCLTPVLQQRVGVLYLLA